MFTDDDLKEYKERAIRLDRQHTLNLLARLEAAEVAVENLESIINSYRKEDLDGWEIELASRAIKAWRKCSGKDIPHGAAGK